MYHSTGGIRKWGRLSMCGAGSVLDISVPSSQFFGENKNALKIFL